MHSATSSKIHFTYCVPVAHKILSKTVLFIANVLAKVFLIYMQVIIFTVTVMVRNNTILYMMGFSCGSGIGFGFFKSYEHLFVCLQEKEPLRMIPLKEVHKVQECKQRYLTCPSISLLYKIELLSKKTLFIFDSLI